MKEYSPADWGATVDYDSWTDTSGKVTQLFLHWGGTKVNDATFNGNINSEKATLRGYEKYHLSKGWQGAAYDWAIGNSGTVYRIRGKARSAATSGDVDGDKTSNNLEGDAIVFLVGEGQSPSEAAFKAARALIKKQGKRELFGHKEAKGTKTTCPGPEVMAFIEELRGGSYSRPSEDKPVKTKEAKAPSSSKNWTEKLVADLGTWKRGQKGPTVRRIQVLITLSGLSSLKADGVYGPQTERAVLEYQQHFLLGGDGIVGPQTWTHMLTTQKY